VNVRAVNPKAVIKVISLVKDREFMAPDIDRHSTGRPSSEAMRSNGLKFANSIYKYAAPLALCRMRGSILDCSGPAP
jgi:hypothetical protein